MNINTIQFNSENTNSLTREIRKTSAESSFKTLLQNSINRIDNNSSGKKERNEKLKDLCVQMESLLVSKMLKTMRNTVPKSQFIHGGFAEDIFQDMLYDEYALSISKNEKLGIASMLYDELSR